METSTKTLARCVSCHHGMWQKGSSKYCDKCINSSCEAHDEVISESSEEFEKVVAILTDKLSTEFKKPEEVAELLAKRHSTRYIKHNSECSAHRADMLYCILEIKR